MSMRLVQLCLPGPVAAVHAAFVPASATLDDVVASIMAEDGEQLKRTMCGRAQDRADDASLWRVQRVHHSMPNFELGDEDLASLAGDRLLDPTLSVEDAFAVTGFSPPAAPPGSRTEKDSTPVDDECVLSAHLQAPSLRLVFIPNSLVLTFEHIPGFSEGFRFQLFVRADTTAGEAVEALVEELGVKKFVVQGHKSARVEYSVRVCDQSGESRSLSTPTRLLQTLQKTHPDASPPYPATFTISPSWLKKAGTVALALPRPHSGSPASPAPRDGARPGVVSRSGSSWKSSSLFGAILGGREIGSGQAATMDLSNAPGDIAGQGDEGEEEGTLKAEKAAEVAPEAAPSKTAGRSRLSALFTDWIAPEASVETHDDPVTAERYSIVLPSVELRRFSSFTPSDRASLHAVWNTTEADAEDASGDREEQPTAQRIDHLGQRTAALSAMHQSSEDRKRFLIAQHPKLQPAAPQPLRPVQTGPATSGEFSLLSNVKAFSFASVGWGSYMNPTSETRATNASSQAPHLQTQETGTSSSWITWWCSPSNATATGGSTTEQAKDSPQLYRDQLRSKKITQRSLVKHLIALRVRLSTSKLSWTEEFVDGAQGLDALQDLLVKMTSDLRRNAGVGQSEESKMVQVECIRCLRALMNTEVGFARVVARPALITAVVFSIYSPFLKLRSLVADLLAAMCLLSKEGRHLVLSAFADARLDHGEEFRFEWLVDRIKVVDQPDDRTIDGLALTAAAEEEEADESSYFEWRIAAMTLINALANAPHNLEERITIRDELARRGLNEAIQGMRQVEPPDALLRQINHYAGEKEEDQEELHERTAGRSRHDTSNVPFSDLIRLAQKHSNLFPKLLHAMRRYIKVFDRKDIDDHLRDDLITVLDNFVEHAAHLEDFDHGWRVFMRQYLASIVHIVGQQSLIRSSRVADTSSVPTSFIEELEGLRVEVDMLSEERARLRKELDVQIAETNTLRALPVDRQIEPGEQTTRGSAVSMGGDKENFTGVVQRLVRKEKEVMDLKAQLEGASRLGQGEEDARKDRASQSRRWEALLQEIAQSKVKTASLETELESRNKEINFLKRTLESVYSRFQSSVVSIAAAPKLPAQTPPALDDPESLATRTLEALAQRDHEISLLKKDLERAKDDLVRARQNPPVFARHAPPPPAPSLPVAASPTTATPEQKAVAVPPPPPPPPVPAPPPSPVAVKAGGTGPQALGSLRSAQPAAATRPPGPPPPPPPPPPPVPPAAGLHAFSGPVTSAPVAPPPPPPPGAPPAPIPPPAPAFPRSSRRLVPSESQPQTTMKPFFWTKLPQTRVRASIWTQSVAAPLDLVDLVTEFTIGPPAKGEPKSQVQSQKKRAPTTLLGNTRAQNVAIMLARLRLPHSAIRDAILQLDDSKLSVDNLKAIKHDAPTSDEIETLKGYTGDKDALAAADQYFLELSSIPRLRERLTAMLYRRRLEMDMEELKPDLSILLAASEELVSSRCFQTLLQTVLAMGNTLNGGTLRGGAAGFSLDSLLKLQDVRTANATSGTPTLLHYLVRAVRRQDPSLLVLLEEMPHIEAASRISTPAVQETVQALVAGIAQAEREVDFLRSSTTSSSRDRFVPVMEQFVRHAAPAMKALAAHNTAVSEQLKRMLLLFGEDPMQSKPEELFDLVAQFASLLQRADAEVQAIDARAQAKQPKETVSEPVPSVPGNEPATPPASLRTLYAASLSPPSLSPSTGSIGRGQFDTAMRDLRNGMSTRRQRSTVDRDRPLSRIFLSN